jgi:uncharacterized protein (TIGR03118 family)
MRPFCRLPRAPSARAFAVLALVAAPCSAGTVYVEKVLTSDGVVAAPNTDPDLINPWGASQSPAGPIWVSDQGKDKSTLYDGAGVKQPLVVDIPFTAGGPHGPTGQAFNPGTSFNLSTDGKTGPAVFLFANLDGSIAAWNPSGDATKATKVFSSSDSAVYTGMTLHTGGGGTGDRIYAVDHANHKIDVVDDAFQKVATSGDFSDPDVPSGLVPFNVAELGGKLYVTYTEQGPGNDEAPLGSGAIASFDLEGNLIKHLSDGGQLATPWGLTIAPENFGDFSGKLLVGNFNEDFGQINAFDPETGKFLGTLEDAGGNPIRNPYLWAVIKGTGGAGTDPDALYITAGPEEETRGVFAEISVGEGGRPEPIPLPPAVVTAPLGGVLAFAGAWRIRQKMSHS